MEAWRAARRAEAAAEARRARLARVTTLPLRRLVGAGTGLAGPRLSTPSLPSLTRWSRAGLRAERALWLGGTLVLLALVTALAWALLATGLAVSRAWLSGERALPTRPALTTVTPAPDLHLLLLTRGTLRPGMSVRVAGSGFSAFAPVRFWLDGRLPFVDGRGWPLLVEADGAGRFAATLRLLPEWPPGQHAVLARDVQSGQGTWLPLRLAPALTATATPGPTAGPSPFPSPSSWSWPGPMALP